MRRCIMVGKVGARADPASRGPGKHGQRARSRLDGSA
jgi:hypothetical protein